MSRLLRVLVLVGLVVVVVVCVAPSAGASPVRDRAVVFPKMSQCPQEDSRECGWDAVHMGDGFGDSFWAPPAGVARVYYNHGPVHRVLFGDWAHVPNSQIGNRVDLINGGSRLVGEKTIWSVGPTSYWAWPGQDRIDYQLGTS
jgi:hypothetical protein